MQKKMTNPESNLNFALQIWLVPQIEILRYIPNKVCTEPYAEKIRPTPQSVEFILNLSKNERHDSL